MLDVRAKIKDPEPIRYRLNEYLYSSINSITVCTDAILDSSVYSKRLAGKSDNTGKINSDNKKVFIAAKRVGVSQIHVFEFFEDAKKRENDMKAVQGDSIEQTNIQESTTLLKKQSHVVTLDTCDDTDA